MNGDYFLPLVQEFIEYTDMTFIKKKHNQYIFQEYSRNYIYTENEMRKIIRQSKN